MTVRVGDDGVHDLRRPRQDADGQRQGTIDGGALTATHQDRVGAWVSVAVGGYLIVRGFIRR